MRTLITGIAPYEARHLDWSEGGPREGRLVLPRLSDFGSFQKESLDISNTGNYLISDGAFRLLDRDETYYIPIWRLKEQIENNEYYRKLSSEFDRVVLITANLIRSNYSADMERSILEKLRLPIVVLGIGIQWQFELNDHTIPAGTAELIRLLREKDASVFCRGEATADYLSGKGLRHVFAVGCPSLHVFVENIEASMARLKKYSFDKNDRIIYSGYLPAETYAFKEQNQFVRAGLRPAYVMQDEVVSYGLECKDQAAFRYDEIQGSVLCEFNLAGTENLLKPFSFFQFFSPTAWRLWAAGSAICVTRRFHGAVAAMQAGVPTLLVVRDDRMREMAEVCGLPAIDTVDYDRDDIGGEVGRIDRVTQFIDRFDLGRALESYRQIVDRFAALREERSL